MIRSEWLVSGMAALMLMSWAASPASFNYLYIEASEGNSSGGHAAIQFEDEVYHFQHVDSGLIRLFRQEEKEFHFIYRYLQNRPMHLSRIEVGDDTFKLLKDQFKWRFLTQENQFKLIEDLHRDRLLLRHLLQKNTGGRDLADFDAASLLRLKGAGLFYSDSDRPRRRSERQVNREQAFLIREVRDNIEQRFGRGFLQRKRKQLEESIEALTPVDWSAVHADADLARFPVSIYSFSDRYSDHLTAWHAVEVLTEATPLLPDVLVQTDRQLFKISEAERRGLLALRQDLSHALIEAFAASRPDWGYAVLVNLARTLAIAATLRSGYWALIDDFAEDSEWLKPAQYLPHRAQLRTLISDAGASLARLRRSAASRQRLTEADYSRIEMAANRYLELLKSEQRGEFRFNGEKTLPSKSIGIPAGPLPKLARARLAAELASLHNVEEAFGKALNRHYRYDLIRRNCVTELFETIHRALLTPYRSDEPLTDPESFIKQESEKRLGGYVDVSMNFIPFVSYRSVQDRYRVVRSLDLDSYRRLELARLANRDGGLLTAFRETSILSSRLYQYNPDDALFLFFTDDQLLLRPLFGAANTAAGIAQGIAGLFSWPADSGKNLKSGATGVLMSLPELFFFNMRKGSYKYLSFHPLADTDLSGY